MLTLQHTAICANDTYEQCFRELWRSRWQTPPESPGRLLKKVNTWAEARRMCKCSSVGISGLSQACSSVQILLLERVLWRFLEGWVGEGKTDLQQVSLPVPDDLHLGSRSALPFTLEPLASGSAPRSQLGAFLSCILSAFFFPVFSSPSPGDCSSSLLSLPGRQTTLNLPTLTSLASPHSLDRTLW